MAINTKKYIKTNIKIIYVSDYFYCQRWKKFMTAFSFLIFSRKQRLDTPFFLLLNTDLRVEIEVRIPGLVKLSNFSLIPCEVRHTLSQLVKVKLEYN